MSKNAAGKSDCLNCGSSLHGQYCGHCGQRASSRFISVWELVRDAFGDMFELDSRLWRTLIPLLIRPGVLTRDYLEGRRARYMPPFRMYLVLSLIFFLVAFFNPRDDMAILFEPTSEPTAEVAAEPEQDEERDADIAAAKAEGREVLEELAAEGIIDPAILDDEEFNDALDNNPEDIPCDIDSLDINLGSGWLSRRLTKEQLVRTCERIKVLGADGFLAAVLDKVPAALIVLLPLMAFVLKLLYPLSRRYYVEHLLFFVHFHAFFFLILTLQILWARFIGITGLPGVIAILPIVAASFYIPAYLYVSMRHVYGQGRLASLSKFILLTISYLIGFSFVMFGALLIAVLSV